MPLRNSDDFEEVGRLLEEGDTEGLLALGSEARRLRAEAAAAGMPVDCCDEWPECEHVLAWAEERDGQ